MINYILQVILLNVCFQQVHSSQQMKWCSSSIASISRQTEGPCKPSKPGFWDPVGRYKMVILWRSYGRIFKFNIIIIWLLFMWLCIILCIKCSKYWVHFLSSMCSSTISQIGRSWGREKIINHKRWLYQR